jgi:hypothetical protein
MAVGRKTGGRKKGSINKATADIKALTEPYSAEAVEKLYWLLNNGESHQVQLSAARELIDRRFGKPPQAIAHSGEVDMGLSGLLQAIDGRTRGLPKGS